MENLFETYMTRVLKEKFPDLSSDYIAGHMEELIASLKSTRAGIDQKAAEISDYLPEDMFTGLDVSESDSKPNKLVRRKSRALRIDQNSDALLNMLEMFARLVLGGDIEDIIILAKRKDGDYNMAMSRSDHIMELYGFMTQAIANSHNISSQGSDQL